LVIGKLLQIIDLTIKTMNFCDWKSFYNHYSKAVSGPIAFTTLLREFGHAMDSYSEDGQTLTHFIVENDEAKYRSKAQLLTPSFFRALSERDRDGNTPIHIIMLKGRLAYLELFYDQVDLAPILSIRNKKGETPLHIAAAKGEPYLNFFKLEEATAALALRNNDGELALDIALKAQNISAAYTLAYYMPARDIYRCFWQANRATKTLEAVFSTGNQEVVKTALTIYYSKCDDEKQCILSCFTKGSLSQYETIAEFYSANYWNCTILTISRLFNRDSVLRGVVENYADSKGQTLLHMFATVPDVRLFNNTISYIGAGRQQFALSKRDSMGRTPLHMMRPNVTLFKHLHSAMEKDLRVLKAVLRVECNSGYTPLQTLCMHKAYGDDVLKCIKFIAEFDKELLTPPGVSLVDLVRKHSGHKELVAYLFEKTEPETEIEEDNPISFATALKQACEALDIDDLGQLTKLHLTYPNIFGELPWGGTCSSLHRAIELKAWRCFAYIALNTSKSLYAVKHKGKTPMQMISSMDNCEAKTMMLAFCRTKYML
jgi:ankyrin repeat protein